MKTRKEGFFWYFWSWTTEVSLCHPIFPTMTVKGTVHIYLCFYDISNFISGDTLKLNKVWKKNDN